MTWQRWKNIMKCYPFEEKRLLKWTPPFIVQPKYDGIRCRAIQLENGQWMLLSSEENVIFSVPHINEGLAKMDIKDIELDGELYCHGMSFEGITSITSRTVNIHPDYKFIKFHVFDYVADLPNGHRVIELDQLIPNDSFIESSPYWICDNLEDIMRTYDKLLNLGYEGIIVRHAFASYVRKRSIYIMKFKPKKEDIYEILNYSEEISISGISKSRLGSITCASGDGNTFNVGTGFSDELRVSLWIKRHNLKGSFIRVQYQHLTSGKKVPRFPVFVEIIKSKEVVK